MPERNEYDVSVKAFAIIVFALPLTLLIPGFSVWDVVPKFRVTRFHAFRVDVSWSQLNAMIVTTLVIFFCFYLEIRKRRLDDMVEKVLSAREATEVTLRVERERQSATMKACVEVLDASTEHYEHLVLLRDDLRKRERAKKQKPPAIELSASELY